MRLAAVVVTYNRLIQIQKTVTRLLEAPLAHVLVIDNGSTDGSRDWLSGVDDPRLELVFPDENLGGAGGFELGLRHMHQTHDPDWIVVMDDDGRPETGALKRFRTLDLSGWDAVSGAVYFPDGTICGMNRPVLNPFARSRVFWHSLLRGGDRSAFHLSDRIYAGTGPIEVDSASFVGLFLSRAAIARVGFPDGRLFIYAEDGLYTLGLTQSGGRLGFFPNIRFEHECATFNAAGAFQPLWKAYYYHRNLMFLYRKAAGLWFWGILPVFLLKWFLKARAYETSAERRSFRRLLCRAIWDGLRGKRHRLSQNL